MKTHIIQLEPHDDIVSARDRMGWSKAERILIVWPEHSPVLNRRLDLLLLQRHSAALGAQLALVSKDREVRYHAPRLGIPVYKSLRKAQNSHWRIPRRYRQPRFVVPDLTSNAIAEDLEIHEPPETPPRLPAKPDLAAKPLPAAGRFAFFFLGVLAFLSITAILLPSAEVELHPETRLQESLIDIHADPTIEDVKITGEIPARPVTIIVEGRLIANTSGAITLPDQPARGEVVFTNLTDQPLLVPIGAVVRSLEPPFLRFEVIQEGELPGGPGNSLSLPVRALSPGASGNLPAGSLRAIEGLLGTQLSANNPQALSAGTDRSEPAPSEADRQLLRESLQASLKKTALEELIEGMGSSDLLLSENLELTEILEEAYTPEDLQPSGQVALNLRLAYQGWVVSGKDMQSLASQVLDTNLPPGFSIDPGPVEIEQIGNLETTAGGAATWKIRAARKIQAQIQPPQVIGLALGQAPLEAAQRIQAALPVSTAPEIMLFPSWWPRLPILPFRIAIRTSGLE